MKLKLFKNRLFYCWFHKRFDECEMIMWVQNNKEQEKVDHELCMEQILPFFEPIYQTPLKDLFRGLTHHNSAVF